jgi:hypothetical protein
VTEIKHHTQNQIQPPLQREKKSKPKTQMYNTQSSPPPLQFEHTTFHINVNKSNGAINDTKQSDSNTKNKIK